MRRYEFLFQCPTFSSTGSPLTYRQQNEYAQILAKRVAEARAQKSELRKRRASSMHK
jgi:hypothetical protein